MSSPTCRVVRPQQWCSRVDTNCRNGLFGARRCVVVCEAVSAYSPNRQVAAPPGVRLRSVSRAHAQPGHLRRELGSNTDFSSYRSKDATTSPACQQVVASGCARRARAVRGSRTGAPGASAQSRTRRRRVARVARWSRWTGLKPRGTGFAVVEAQGPHAVLTVGGSASKAKRLSQLAKPKPR